MPPRKKKARQYQGGHLQQIKQQAKRTRKQTQKIDDPENRTTNERQAFLHWILTEDNQEEPTNNTKTRTSQPMVRLKNPTPI